MNVLFLNSLGSVSRGNIAVQTGCIKSIRANLPDAKITIWSMRAAEDTSYTELDVNLFQHPWISRRRSLLLTVFTSVWHIMGAYSRTLFIRKPAPYDVLVSLNMDGFNDRQYGIFTTLQGQILALASKYILKKPIILIPASVGPFKHRFIKRFTRFALNRFEIVTVRGETSQKYLKQIGVSNPEIDLLADLGFLLEPCTSAIAEGILTREKIRTIGHPLIGIAPSIEMGLWSFPTIRSKAEKKEKYVQLMAEIADFIVELTDSFLCFVPNVPPDPYTKESADIIAAKLIVNKMKRSQNAKIASDSYSASEVKGIIGKCDMFLSCRMHSAIASTSMSVPTVVMAYGTKFDDVIAGTMGQQEYLVRIESTPELILKDLKTKLGDAWQHRLKIRSELEIRTENAKARALKFGELVEKLAKVNSA
jgi:colanic acid/amylovoran biosynthesis protein